MKEEGVKVVLRSLQLTSNMILEEIANLDSGVNINSDGSLPSGKYGIYYRVKIDNHNYGSQEIVDWSGAGPTEIVHRLLK